MAKHLCPGLLNFRTYRIKVAGATILTRSRHQATLPGVLKTPAHFSISSCVSTISASASSLAWSAASNSAAAARTTRKQRSIQMGQDASGKILDHDGMVASLGQWACTPISTPRKHNMCLWHRHTHSILGCGMAAGVAAAQSMCSLDFILRRCVLLLLVFSVLPSRLHVTPSYSNRHCLSTTSLRLVAAAREPHAQVSK